MKVELILKVKWQCGLATNRRLMHDINQLIEVDDH